MTVRLPPGGGAYEGQVGNGRVWGAGRGGGVALLGLESTAHVPLEDTSRFCSRRSDVQRALVWTRFRSSSSPGGQEVVPKEEDDSSCPARGPRAGSYAEGDSKIREPIFFCPALAQWAGLQHSPGTKGEGKLEVQLFLSWLPNGQEVVPDERAKRGERISVVVVVVGHGGLSGRRLVPYFQGQLTRQCPGERREGPKKDPFSEFE
ncbi:unnamed protein product [Calypogeia fissa]